MGRESVAKPRRYACFTPEQQDYYDSLTWRIRRYVDYRGQGNSKAAAYRLAGFETKYPAQASQQLEKAHDGVPDLIEAIAGQRKVRQLGEEDSNINKQIDALAIKGSADKLQAVVDSGDTETAERIQFYRDIINGKIKTIRKTKKYDANKIFLGMTIEEVSDINVKVQARKELDKILGLNQLPDFGQITSGNFTFNFVDASNKEELDDSRNKIVLDPKDVEILDGEPVIEVREGDNGGSDK